MSSFTNDFANLSLHRKSIRGTTQDYVIKFKSIKHDFLKIAVETSELIEQLLLSFGDSQVKGRLIAKVNFEHFNLVKETTDERSYYFPSYGSENIVEIRDFFDRHLMKIASRLDSFTVDGSSLIIKNIDCIFVQLSVVN